MCNVEQTSYFGPMIQTIVDNVQISIENIHIRYEDNITAPQRPFSIGFTLAELSAASTDRDWSPNVTSPDADTIFKLLKLRHFGMYCSTDDDPDASPESLLLAISKSQDNLFDKQFILNPVSGDGKLVWLKKVNTARPQYDLSVDFKDIAFNLDDTQYATFISVFGSFSRQMKSREFSKYRPPASITPKLDPKAWLKYAGTCVLSRIKERNHKWSWEYFKARRDMRKQYVLLFLRKNLNTISEGELYDLEEMDEILPFEDIRFYRRIAKSKLKASAAPTPAGEVSPGWYGWITGTPAANTNIPKDGTTAQLKELYDAFDFEDRAAISSADIPFESVFFNFKCNISTGSFSLRAKKGRQVSLVSSIFSGLEINWIQYPQSYSLELLVSDMSVHENSLDPTPFDNIISAKERCEGESKYFFTLKYEHLPLKNQDADDSLVVRMRPLRVLVNVRVVDSLFGFFKVEQSEYEAISGLQVSMI